MASGRKTVACFDDDDDDGATGTKWIMGIPYTELREEERRLDVFSTMWITYRSGFPRMDPYGYTDDSGWGCMLRSAQMLMTQALQRHTLGRSWRVPRTLEERLLVTEYRALIRLFADHPGEESLFSIHNMCQVGIRYDKLPGEWYGPTTAACVLRDISELFAARWSPPTTPPQKSQESPQPAPPPPPPRVSSPEEPPERSPDRLAPSADPAEDSSATGGAGHTVTTDEKTSREGASDPRSAEDAARVAGRPDAERPDGAPAPSSNGGSGRGGAREDVVFPSARPLRVFVSQGDVVYIDEVEAVAIRGGNAGAATAAASPGGRDATDASNGDTGGGGSENVGKNGAPAPEAESGGGRATGKQGGGAEPAFFDPLLNPGSGGGRSRGGEAWSSAVVLLVPLRLGLDELSPGYVPSLLEMLRVPQSLGFLGGRPNHAIFFIGAQGETLTGLDPHTTQPAPEMGGAFPSKRYVHSLHCQSAVSMDVHRIDPSLALAFYLPDRASFQDLIKKIGETSPPPFSVEQTRPDYEGEMGLAFMINQRDDDGTTDDDDDEYVFVKSPER